MKYMSKIVALLVVVALMLSLAACNGHKPVDTPTDPSTTIPPIATDPIVTEPVETEPAVTEPIGPDDNIVFAPTEGEDVPLSATGTVLAEIIKNLPLEFGTITMDVDMNNAASLNYYAGLTSADGIEGVAANEPMMSSQAFSIVLVKVAEGTDPKTIEAAIKSGINPAKWLCVEADDVQTAVYDQYVLLVMMSSDFGRGMTSKVVVNAFNYVLTPEEEIEG